MIPLQKDAAVYLSPRSALQQEPVAPDAPDASDDRTSEIFKALKGGRNLATADEWSRRLEPMTPAGQQKRILELSRTRLVAADADRRARERRERAVGHDDAQSLYADHQRAWREGNVAEAAKYYVLYRDKQREAKADELLEFCAASGDGPVTVAEKIDNFLVAYFAQPALYPSLTYRELEFYSPR